MRMGPIVSFGLSILVGVAAVFFGRGWLDSEADAVAVPSEVAVQIDTRQILVADILIERGDLLQETSFRFADWPTEHLPEGAIEDLSVIIGPEGDFPFALGVMVPGEPLHAGKLSPNIVRDTLAPMIERGFRAVSVEVEDHTGVSGFVLPDTRVDVSVYFTIDDPNTGDKKGRSETLAQDIRVLAVDQIFGEYLEGAKPARTVTLQVTPAQAAAIGRATEIGTIGLSLRAEDEESFLPPPPRRVTRARAPARKFTQIRVIQGDDEATVTTPAGRTAKRPEGANQ